METWIEPDITDSESNLLLIVVLIELVKLLNEDDTWLRLSICVENEPESEVEPVKFDKSTPL